MTIDMNKLADALYNVDAVKIVNNGFSPAMYGGYEFMGFDPRSEMEDPN